MFPLTHFERILNLRNKPCETLIHNPQARVAYETGCEECVKIGGQWVHLRMCLICGKIGCCDASPMTHATKHFRATGHAVVRSIEPGEDWKWNYETEEFMD